MSHISRTRGHSRQLAIVTKTTGTVHGTLTPCSAKIAQSGPNHSFVIRFDPWNDTASAPYILLGILVGASLDQSLDSLCMALDGSPHQGRPALLRDNIRHKAAALHSVATQVSLAF
jgi:hypothetical protein